MQVEDVGGQQERPEPDLTAASVDEKTLLPGKGGRDIKDKLSELFIPHKLKKHAKSEAQLLAALAGKKKERGHVGSLDWAAGYMPRGRAEISEACRQAFTATCHLLLECTTFPVYLSEDETLVLNADMFDLTGQHTDVYRVVTTAVRYVPFFTSIFFHRSSYRQLAGVVEVLDDAVLPVQGLQHPAHCSVHHVGTHQPLSVPGTGHPGQAQALPGI